MALLHDIVEIDASDVMVYDLADTSDKNPMVNNLLENNTFSSQSVGLPRKKGHFRGPLYRFRTLITRNH